MQLKQGQKCKDPRQMLEIRPCEEYVTNTIRDRVRDEDKQQRKRQSMHGFKNEERAGTITYLECE